MMRSLLFAIGFLTILPVRDHGQQLSGHEDLGKAAVWFPLVGVLIGAFTAAAYYGLMLFFPGLLAAALAATIWIVMTGGLHLDGLADCCDGLLCSYDMEKRLQIMKDPHHGTFAGIGMILVIMLKVIGLYSLPVGDCWLVLLFAAAFSRWLLLPAGLQSSARLHSLGWQFSQGIQFKTLLFGALPVLILQILIGWKAFVIALMLWLFSLLIIRFVRMRLGGMTGDAFGLIVELTELLVLIAFNIKNVG